MPSRPRWRGACHERASDPGRNEPATDAQRAASGRAACVPAQVRGSTPGRSGGGMSRFRVSMDIGGTFTDVVAYDEEHGTYRAGKSSTTPNDLTEGVFAALGTGRRLACRDRVHGARHDAGPQRLPPTPRRARAAAGDARRRRRLPHRPRQPAPPLRRPLPQADAARAAPRHRARSAGGSDWDGAELEPLDEDAVRAARPARARRGLRRDRRRLPLLLRRPDPRAARGGDHPRGARDAPSPSRTASRASGASTSAPRRRSSTPTPPRSCAATSSGSSPSCSAADSPCRCT